MLKTIKSENCILLLAILNSVFLQTISRTEELGLDDIANNATLEESLRKGKMDHEWPLGVIPYYLDETSYDSLVAERIRLAMNTIEETSCIEFKPIQEAKHQTPWIHITNQNKVRDCVHGTPRHKSRNEMVLVLGFDCMQRHEILHSLMHAIGFRDEISHPQRDNYIRILWDNIQPEYRSLFYLAQKHEFPLKTSEFDPMSIMQFHDRAFTRNGKATIAPLISGLVINPSRELSPLDKMKLRMMYSRECNRRKIQDLVDECRAAFNNDRNDGIIQNDNEDNDRNIDAVRNNEDKSEKNYGDNDKVSKGQDTNQGSDAETNKDENNQEGRDNILPNNEMSNEEIYDDKSI